ncbi:hypothetical protein PBCVCvsA1_364R [Paramecium bursaria Chlorella virus CvsA1]|nr:hypothetical protein PBCVCviKI_356R [Paramecium bursaria Chlorella virus CviKI]AGE52526.1 hypothetical protein PBCVCvsA1_364R [Paramecium bursaria Chlorella virus CvsA1]AGE55290.1 hypothetical protein PBCVMA1E_393R [Paramecium bursaria Chlorella virus MA1E]
MATAMMMSIAFNAIIDIIDEAILKGNSKQAVIEIIEDFAAGKDGVLGNADDRLSPEAVTVLKNMIEDGTILRLVERMYKSSIFKKIMSFLFPRCYA